VIGVFRRRRERYIPDMRVFITLALSCARKVRIVLREKNLDFTLKNEKVLGEAAGILASTRPARCRSDRADGTVLADTGAIVEYLDEVYREKILIGLKPGGPRRRAPPDRLGSI